MGGYERRSDRPSCPTAPARRTTRSRPTSTAACWKRTGTASRRSPTNSKRRVPAMAEITVTKLINGPEAFTPGQRVLPRRDRGRGLLRLRRLLRARPRRRRRDRQGRWPSGSSTGETEPRPLAHGHPPLRRRSTARPSYTYARIRRDLRDLLRHPLPQPRAQRRAAAAGLAASTPGTASTAPPSARSPAGSGSTGTSRTPPPATRRCGRAAGRRSTGRRRSAPSTARPASAVGLFDESSFAKLEIERAGRGRASSTASATTGVARGVGQITYTQMLNRRGGIECDFTVARLGEERFSIVTGTAFGNHDREWMRRHLPARRRRRGSHDVTSQWACFGIWGPRARDVLAPLTPHDLGNEAFPYMTLRETTVGDVPVRALRVTYVGELGWELYCPTEYGLGLWRALWEAGAAARHRRRRLPGDRLAAAGEGLPGLGRRHHPGRDPVRGRRRLLRQARQGGRLHRPRRAGRGEGAPGRAQRLCCLVLEDPRSIALGNEPVRVGGEIVGRVDHRRLRLHGRALDRLRLPAARARGAGNAREVEIFGRWVGARSRPSRCWTRRTPGCAPTADLPPDLESPSALCTRDSVAGWAGVSDTSPVHDEPAPGPVPAAAVPTGQSWGWFLAWVPIGAAWALAVVGAMSIGVLVAPVAALLTAAFGWTAGGRESWGCCAVRDCHSCSSRTSTAAVRAGPAPSTTARQAAPTSLDRGRG